MLLRLDGSGERTDEPVPKREPQDGAGSAFLGASRVKRVAQAVADEVDREDEDDREDCGRDPLPRIPLEGRDRSCGIEHVPPARGEPPDTETEVAETGLDQDGRGD